MSRTGKSTETERKLMLPRGREGKRMTAHEYSTSFEVDENVLELMLINA
jgi:hypothetical protein